MTGHQGGLHPEGGYRTADRPKDKAPKEPHKFSTAEKVIGLCVVGPVLTMVLTGLIAVAIKFIQICLAWIS